MTPAAVSALIAKSGQAVMITHRVAGAYDPATGAAAITETAAETTGVVLPLPRGLTHRADTNIALGDKQLLLSAVEDLSLDDTLTIGGDDYSLIEVSPLAPAGTVLFQDCIIRGAS